jgi:diguanylate cyclase (GGDEF)-like protein
VSQASEFSLNSGLFRKLARMRAFGWVVAIVLLCLAPARAAGIDWAALSSTVIRTVMPTRDMPVPLLALAFTQDRTGFLWAGGETGLFRWDGYQFRIYAASGAADDGLPNHFVQALHTGRDGRLWVGTAAGGLAVYDERADRFRPVPIADRQGAAQSVWSLDDDGAGGLWIATDRGLAHLDAHDRAVPMPHDPGRVFAAPGHQVEAVLRGRDGTVWIGGGDGLARIGQDGQSQAVSLPVPGGAQAEVSHLLQDSAGRIWAGTRHHGAYVLDRAGRQAIAVKRPAGMTVQEGGLEIMAMTEAEPGRVWLGSFGHGILDVDAASMAVRQIIRDPLVQGGLDADLVYGLFTDRSGITWIGTTAALDQFVPPLPGLHTLFAGAGGMPTDVTAVVARPDGTVWLASQTDGILILGRDGKPVRTLPVPRVFCMAAEADGPVYIGTRSGLFVATPSGDRVSPVTMAMRRVNAGVLALAVINGTVWVGGDNDNGLWELHPGAAGSWIVARQFAAPPLPNASIHAIAPTYGGKLVIGTAQDAALLDPVIGTMRPLRLAHAGRHGGTASQVASLLTDRRGRLWIGTDDAGIAVVMGRDAAGGMVLHWITAADGLPDSDMNRMVADETGRVWVATDNGLAVIDPENFAVRALRRADGVAIGSYWGMSGDRDTRGDVLFGGMGGLTVIEPDKVRDRHSHPAVAISEIRVGGRVLRNRDAELVIRPDANSLAVEFATLDFSAPERNLYRYKLEGFDSGFIATDAKHRVASYTNLPPGHYTLLLQGSDRNGVWAAPAALTIRVLPAWFQTIYCRVVEIAALAGLCGVIVQGRTIWLRRRQAYLMSLVQERTAALVKRTEELVSSERKLTQLAYFDPLTGLPNRRSFNETLQTLLDALPKPASGFVLILVDLDGFKHVNDTLGHDAGDAVLVVAAGRLRAALREGDFVARLGGDEFAILLQRVSEIDAVRHVCDRLVSGMTGPIDIQGRPARIGTSVGAALAPRHGRTAEDLYKHADEALYQAKRAGKGMWRWYDGDEREVA